MSGDLPVGYRWATAEETEDWVNVPGIIVVPRSVDNEGNPYTQGESDLAVPITRPHGHSYEDYLSDEPDQHGIPDGLTRREYEQLPVNDPRDNSHLGCTVYPGYVICNCGERFPLAGPVIEGHRDSPEWIAHARAKQAESVQ